MNRTLSPQPVCFGQVPASHVRYQVPDVSSEDMSSGRGASLEARGIEQLELWRRRIAEDRVGDELTAREAEHVAMA